MKGSCVHRFCLGLGKASTSISLPYLCGRDWYMEDSWPLKTGQIGCPETSVRIYHYSLRNSTEERSSHLLVTFPRQQWLRERSPMLRYAFIACLYTITPDCTIDRKWWRVGREVTQLAGQYSGVQNVLLYITGLRPLFKRAPGKSNALKHQNYWQTPKI